jgi:ABC-type transport system substrate-binding protein
MAPLSKYLPVLVVFTLGAACAQAAPDGPRQDNEAMSPKSGGMMQFAQRQASPHLDPFSGLGTAQTQTLGPVYEPLVQIEYRPGEDFRQDYPLVPWLAERWEVVDPTTYVFHMRRGAKWHDGQEVTAEDVAFTYKYVLDPKVLATQKANLAPLETFEATDTYTLRITSKGPNPALLNNLAGVSILPRPPELMQPWATLGWPAMTINGGISSNGLPLGLQMVSGFGKDWELMRVGAWGQRALGRLNPPPLP